MQADQADQTMVNALDPTEAGGDGDMIMIKKRTRAPINVISTTTTFTRFSCLENESTIGFAISDRKSITRNEHRSSDNEMFSFKAVTRHMSKQPRIKKISTLKCFETENKFEVFKYLDEN